MSAFKNLIEAHAFGGKTYLPSRDRARLNGQLNRVYHVMKDGHWRSLSEIAVLAGASESGASARIRDLRKRQYGAHIIDSRPRHGGVWEYRMP